MAYGLYSHIQSNRRRSVVLLIGLFFLVYLMTFAGALVAEVVFGGDARLDFLINAAVRRTLYSLPWVTIGTLLWIFIAYKFHQAMIDAITGGQDVTRQDEPRLYNLLENLCISRGITMPKLKVMESDALNAFATGLNEKQYSITVTTGLLARLDDPEVEAVLGHELTHIRNGDVRLLIVAVIIAGAISFFAEIVFRALFQGGFNWRGSRRGGDSDRGKGGAMAAILIALALIAVAWLLSIVIRFALSRQREFLADAGSVELTKNPDAMISALRKIEGRGELEGSTSAVMEMCVDNPRSGFADLFSTHPSIESRVEALVKFAGGHDPGPIALPEPQQADAGEIADQSASGPFDQGGAPTSEAPRPGTSDSRAPESGAPKPFLPPEPPIRLGSDPSAPHVPGPWDSKR
jgi:heat shock protein HtpX